MTTKQRFALGVVIGIVALVVLFAFPTGPLWVLLLIVSGGFTTPRRPERESTKDASSMALTVCFVGAVLLLSLFLIPDSFWSGLNVRIPDWAYGEPSQGMRTVPLWARLVLAAFWSLVTFRRYQQLGNGRVEVAV